MTITKQQRAEWARKNPEKEAERSRKISEHMSVHNPMKGKMSFRKGKSIVEEYGVDKAQEIRDKNSKSHIGIRMSFTPEELCKRKKRMIFVGKSGLGKKLTEEHKQSISLGVKKAIVEGRMSIVKRFEDENPFFGKRHSKETKKIMSEGKIGLYSLDKHPNWKGGKSFEPYGVEFNKDLKERIRKLYRYRCQQCFRHQSELRDANNRERKLDIHHIDYDKKNNEDSNLIPLCRVCHVQTNYGREDWTNYFKEKVEGLI